MEHFEKLRCDAGPNLSECKVIVFPPGTVITEEKIRELAKGGKIKVFDYWQYIDHINK